ncbi:hypothetical protein CEUSTIGMA_g1134.t1 [Chlamydomonas eustigma]|uniref:Phycocyanobilin:ferredoxin oxidoreductase n=1 Tax=Chlamydomonas eustigma TaxID=1157962 RepID=A0A250WS75_9CHLO|nr:hypothetical protein CEUSTIGMA_g1134.t1 [Chlamydomonas eustigma]|eukprot:GAX73683.1 hypothetical protein CEUSTIGMA_g1134.t1 [Chlamydomonas eustigma]
MNTSTCSCSYAVVGPRLLRHPRQSKDRTAVNAAFNARNLTICSAVVPRHHTAHPSPRVDLACDRYLKTAQKSRSVLRPCASSSSSSPQPEPSSYSPPDPSASPSVPWTPEDLERMVQEEQANEEQALGATWRQFFTEDPEELFEYADRDYAFHTNTLSMMSSLNESQSEAVLFDPRRPLSIPSSVASEINGMGCWRLANSVDAAIQFLVTRIEGSWRELLKSDLNLYPPIEWKAHGWDWCDSMDPGMELEGFADVDVPNPKPGEEGFPRLLLENRIYCSKVFRKLHIEVAIRQDGLQVLHVVLYPRYKYDLPILAMDLVIAKDRVSLVVVDACPISKNKTLPPHYMQTMHELQELFLTNASNQRKIPEWGKAIFSPLCVCMTPKDGEELAGVMKYMVALHRAHLMLTYLIQPVDESTRRGALKAAELLEGHKRFVEKQLENKKTSRVLETAFGEAWTTAYMQEVMFDFKPDSEPPFVDASIFQLYDYYDDYPELGGLAEEFVGLRDSVDKERAEEYLNELLITASEPGNPFNPSSSSSERPSGSGNLPASSGESQEEEEEERPAPLSSAEVAARIRAEWAMTKMYETDLQFKASVDAVIPEAWQLLVDGTLGTVLVDYLKGAIGEDSVEEAQDSRDS